LGRRIRRARQAAGLTQSALADGDVTPTYVSRIESGQRRPEATLLGRFAVRMGITLEELLGGSGSDRDLELKLKLDHAELALVSGRADEALTLTDALLAEIDGPPFEDVARAAQQVRAGALEARGDLSAAIQALVLVTSTPRADTAWLKSLIALSRCYRDSGDLARAISTGEEARATIEDLGLEGLTESIQLALTVAGAYMLRGDTDYALNLCLEAVDEAEKYDSAIAKASAYWNASLLQARSGSVEIALETARKALATFELGEDIRNRSRLRSQVAELQLKLDPPDAAGALLTLEVAAEEMTWSPASTIDRARQHLTAARAKSHLDDHDGALEELVQALALAPAEAAILQAEALVLRGELEGTSGDLEAARSTYVSAIAILTSVGADRDAAQVWYDLGALLQQVGETGAAADAFQRAAASRGLVTTTRRAPASPFS
jgi:tetratricopeptide (TPR) repeat protein